MIPVNEDAAPTFRPEKYRFIRRRLSLDLMAIDEEISEIGTLIQDAGECVAFAIEIRESAKENLEIMRARVAAELRALPTASGKERSEARIENELPLDKNYQDRLTNLQTARLDAALWMTLQEALRAKSGTIRAAADLVTAGFISMDYLTNKRRNDIRNAVQQRPITKAVP